MTKSDALRLGRGDRVLFGPARRLADCWWTDEGEVEHVTPRGGVKIAGHGWVPYSNIVRLVRKAEPFAHLYGRAWDGSPL